MILTGLEVGAGDNLYTEIKRMRRSQLHKSRGKNIPSTGTEGQELVVSGKIKEACK